MPTIELTNRQVADLIKVADTAHLPVADTLREHVRWVAGDAQGMTVDDLDDGEEPPQLGDIVQVDGVTWEVVSRERDEWVLACIDDGIS